LQQQQQVVFAAVLATLQHNQQHKLMMVIPSSGCSIGKGAATETENQKSIGKEAAIKWQPTMMAIAMTTLSSNSSAISNTAKAVIARAVAAA